MQKSYMPAKEADAVAWSANFSALLTLNFAQYGVDQAEADAFAAVNTALQLAYAKATTTVTRTKITVADKNTAMGMMKKSAGYLVSIVQGRPTLSDGQKLQLGITVRVTHGTPIPAPSQKPFIKTVGTDGRNGTFELRQNSTRRGKPKNVAGAMVFTYTGPNAPQDINAWKFATATTKTTIELPFPPSATGDTVWVTAFWQNAKDESGPAANPVSVNLPAGGMLPKETVEAMKIAA